MWQIWLSFCPGNISQITVGFFVFFTQLEFLDLSVAFKEMLHKLRLFL